MAGSGGKKSPLIADRRYPANRAAQTQKQQAPKQRAPRPKRPSGSGRGGGGGNIIMRLLAGIFRFFFRLIWGIGWRVGLFAGMILFGITYYYYAQLPAT
jgi:penicillin-binding protein 1A